MSQTIEEIELKSLGKLVIPRQSVDEIVLKESPSDEEIQTLLKQMQDNSWLLNYDDKLALSEGRVLVAVIDRCQELPDYKEVNFRIITQNPALKDNDFVLPGFLLSPNMSGVNLDDEVLRTGSYVLEKHLKPVDKPQIVNVGQFTYTIEKIKINSVKNDEAELIVEVSKIKCLEERKSCVDFFVNETLPQLNGGYQQPRIKALTEFMRAFMEKNYSSFASGAVKSEATISKQKAVKALHTLTLNLMNRSEPKTFKIYPASIINDLTGHFTGDVQLYDLERELFSTNARYQVKTAYEIGFIGGHSEVQEFKKQKLLEIMSEQDRKFYESTIDWLHEDFSLDVPLKLRIVSKII
ncbi:hypothetical protein HY837_04775 [archaeon]|nr:hypothetical protein [archaeon]